jgi:hypothetical protein
MRFLVIQIFHRASDSVNISLDVRTTAGAVFRLAFGGGDRRLPSSSKKAIPLDDIPADIWVNLCFDLEVLVPKYEPGCNFVSLEAIEIAPTCLIRWVFESRTPLSPDQRGRDLPNRFKLASIRSETIVVAHAPETPKGQRKSGIPIRRPSRKKDAEGGPKSMGMSFEDDFEGDEDPPQLPVGEEEELELVYIEVLGCYYCPNNQKYYQIGEDTK